MNLLSVHMLHPLVAPLDQLTAAPDAASLLRLRALSRSHPRDAAALYTTYADLWFKGWSPLHVVLGADDAEYTPGDDDVGAAVPADDGGGGSDGGGGDGGDGGGETRVPAPTPPPSTTDAASHARRTTRTTPTPTSARAHSKAFVVGWPQRPSTFHGDDVEYTRTRPPSVIVAVDANEALDAELLLELTAIAPPAHCLPAGARYSPTHSSVLAIVDGKRASYQQLHAADPWSTQELERRRNTRRTAAAADAARATAAMKTAAIE